MKWTTENDPIGGLLMPIYLSPIIGSGTADDAFTPVWPGGPGEGWIDLRPDGTQAAGRGLLYLPVPSSDPRLDFLADQPTETLTVSRRTRLQNALSVTVSASRLDAIVMELLTVHARTDGTRWRPLRPTAHGDLEIWLGGLARVAEAPLTLRAGQPGFWIAGLGWLPFGARLSRRALLRLALVVPTMAALLGLPRPLDAAVSGSEEWPTNGTTISTGQDQPWNEDTNDAEVSGNVLRATATGAARHGRCLTILATDNHEHRATATLVRPVGVGLNSRAGIGVRKVDSTVLTAYVVLASRGQAGDLRLLRKVVAGVNTTLATSDTNDPGSQAALLCRANGSSIYGEVGGGIFGPVTDMAITGNRQVSYYLLQVDETLGDSTLDGHTFRDIGPRPGTRTLLGVGT